MKKLSKILFLVILSFIMLSCNQSLKKLNETPNIKEDDAKEDRTIVRTFLIEWQLQNNRLTQLPREKKEKALKKCKHKKLVLIKIDTNSNNTAKGTFKCID